MSQLACLIFKNKKIALKNICLLVLQDLHSFINTNCITPCLNIGMFTKSTVTKNIFNLQEWHPNIQNCKSLFQ